MANSCTTRYCQFGALAIAFALRRLWLCCGSKDGLIRISQGMHAYLKEKGVADVWNVDSHGHDPAHWRNNLYHFVQRIFNEDAQ